MYAFHPSLVLSLLVVIIPLFDIIVATYNYYYDYLFVISQIEPEEKQSNEVARHSIKWLKKSVPELYPCLVDGLKWNFKGLSMHHVQHVQQRIYWALIWMMKTINQIAMEKCLIADPYLSIDCATCRSIEQSF